MLRKCGRSVVDAEARQQNVYQSARVMELIRTFDSEPVEHRVDATGCVEQE